MGSQPHAQATPSSQHVSVPDEAVLLRSGRWPPFPHLGTHAQLSCWSGVGGSWPWWWWISFSSLCLRGRIERGNIPFFPHRSVGATGGLAYTPTLQQQSNRSQASAFSLAGDRVAKLWSVPTSPLRGNRCCHSLWEGIHGRQRGPEIPPYSPATRHREPTLHFRQGGVCRAWRRGDTCTPTSILLLPFSQGLPDGKMKKKGRRRGVWGGG